MWSLPVKRHRSIKKLGCIVAHLPLSMYPRCKLPLPRTQIPQLWTQRHLSKMNHDHSHQSTCYVSVPTAWPWALNSRRRGCRAGSSAKCVRGTSREGGGQQVTLLTPPTSIKDTPLAPSPLKPSQPDPVANPTAVLTELPPKPG